MRKARTRFALVGVIAALAAAWSAPAAATAAFGPAFDINDGNPGYGSITRPLDVNADGDGLVTWTGPDGGSSALMARTVSATGALGPVLRITSDFYATGPIPRWGADLGDSGDAAFIWLKEAPNDDVVVRFRTLSADGVLGPALSLDRFQRVHFEAVKPSVEVDGTGDSRVVWQATLPAGTPGDGTESLWTRTISPSGVLGPKQLLAEETVIDGDGGLHGPQLQGPQLAINDVGDAVVSWLRSHHDSDLTTYEARIVSQAGVRGPIKIIRSRNEPYMWAAEDVEAELDPDGNAIFSWRRNDPDVGIGASIEARTLTDGVRLGRIQKLADQLANFDRGLALALDTAGNAIVVWAKTPKVIQARRMAASSALGPRLTLSPAPITGGRPPLPYPDVAVDADGDAVVVWRRFDGSSPRILARTISSANVLGSLETLSAPGQYAWISAVGIDRQGDHALAVWQAGSLVQGALGP